MRAVGIRMPIAGDMPRLVSAVTAVCTMAVRVAAATDVASVTAAVSTVTAASVATVLGLCDAGCIEKREEDERRNGMRTAHGPPTFCECCVSRATLIVTPALARCFSSVNRVLARSGYARTSTQPGLLVFAKSGAASGDDSYGRYRLGER